MAKARLARRVTIADRSSDRRAFATARLSAGAHAVRDLIVDAWQASGDAPVGYPMVNVRDIESRKVKETRQLLARTKRLLKLPFPNAGVLLWRNSTFLKWLGPK